MRYLIAMVCLGTALVARPSPGGDIFSTGEKLFGEKKEPLIIRVNPATDEATAFTAGKLDRKVMEKLSSASKSEQETALSDSLAAIETSKNEIPLLAEKRGKNESTPACYGYYYGWYPWQYFRPIYVVYVAIPVTYFYSWHTYHHGYVYYLYL